MKAKFHFTILLLLLANIVRGQLTVQSGGTIQIAEGAKILTQHNVNAFNDIQGTGTITLNGSTLQTINMNGFSLANLEIANNSAAGVTINGITYITRSLFFGNVNGAKLTTGGFLTFRSDAAATARIADISNGGVNSGNTILDDVTVERYIPYGKRAYRQLASGVNSTANIFTNWQESGGNTSGFGIHITGSQAGANGFDATASGAASMFTYAPGSPNFTAISNTNATNLKALQGYRAFLIGDRNANLTILNNTGTGTSNIDFNQATTLRAKGTIVTGPVTFTHTGTTANGSTDNTITLGETNGNFSLIANPYWSPVNFDAISKSNIEGTYWIWDPSIGNRGAYVSWTTSSGLNSNGASSMDNNIQPGQSIFVQTIGSSPSIIFSETNKTSVFTNTFRAPNETPSKMRIYLFENNSLAANGTMQDAATVAFRDDFFAAVGQEDATKFTNTDENIAIRNGTTLLGVEGRPTVIAPDTIQIRIWKLFSNNNYTLKLEGFDFDAGITGIIEDKFLNQQHPLQMAGSITVPFTFSIDSASYFERFRLIFRPATPLPVGFTQVQAYVKNTGIQVEWHVTAEENVLKYSVEKSWNGVSFDRGGEVAASNSKTYQWFDGNPNSGNNFYRIKVINKDNSVSYSNVVQVKSSPSKGDIIIYPNPIKGSVINLQLTNQEKGNYSIQLFNTTGQQLYNHKMIHPGGSVSLSLQVSTSLIKGIYQLVIKNGKNTITQQVIVE